MNTPDPGWRCLFVRLAAAAVLAALAGCGPTGGGTGTGTAAVTLADFGATAASSCSSPFAQALDCGSSSEVPATPALLPGTAPVLFVGNAASGPYTLSLQGDNAELQSRCLATRFDGVWGLLPDGSGRYFGTFVGPPGGDGQPAMLWVQAVAGSNDRLQLLVLDAKGLALFGPLQVQRVAALPIEAPQCP